MTWLTWRQHRWDLASALAVVFLLGGTMVVLTAAGAGLATEIARVCSTSNAAQCGALRMEYATSFGRHQTLLTASIAALPLLVGIFVGAPLAAREFEQGTHLLVWTQGITRRRWFVTKIALVGTAVLVGAALMGTTFQIWASQQSVMSGGWYQFDARPPVFIAYALFALALGIALGSIFQRTLPAMAGTLVGFVAVRIVIEQLWRPHFLPPLTYDANNSGPNDPSPLFIGPPESIDLAGHSVSATRVNEIFGQCASAIKGDKSSLDLHNCFLDHGVRMIGYYQPESRFWLFQSIEAVIFMVLVAALLVLAYHMVMRKR